MENNTYLWDGSRSKAKDVNGFSGVSDIENFLAEWEAPDLRSGYPHGDVSIDVLVGAGDPWEGKWVVMSVDLTAIANRFIMSTTSNELARNDELEHFANERKVVISKLKDIIKTIESAPATFGRVR